MCQKQEPSALEIDAKNKEKSKVCPGKCTDTRQGKKNKKNIGNYMEHKLGKH